MKHNRGLGLLALLAALIIPTGLALADNQADNCADGTWQVEAGQTLEDVAAACGVTVQALATTNGIGMTAALSPAQVLVLPAPTSGGAEDVSVTFGALRYIENGRAAVVDVTVTNDAVLPAVDGGRQYFGTNPDGGKQWVTLLGVLHQTVPVALIDSAPLWQATVTTSDGNVWTFPVGCEYLETVEYVGFEPTGDGGFFWYVDWPGGWYTCGYDYESYPPDLTPGQSATQPLTIYLQHPREWNSPAPNRTITSIEIGVWRAEADFLPAVGSISY